MNRLRALLIAAIVGLMLLTAAAPLLLELSNAVIPAVVAIGVVVALLRLVWFYTNRL